MDNLIGKPTRRDLLKSGMLLGGGLVGYSLTGRPVPAMAADAGARNYIHYTLDNGLEAILVPDHRLPIVTHMLWYKVGAGDEAPGKTGLAHFFEHAMFKGTKKFPAGTADRFVNHNGGSQNAFTHYDYTTYVQRMAREHLGTLMEMEADRMNNLLLTPEQASTELKAVIEEKRGDETQAANLFYQEIIKRRFAGHRLATPIIGSTEDVSALKYDDLMSFYRQYYAPNNAILVVVGDIVGADFRKMVADTYGKLKANPALQPRQRPPVPMQPSQAHYVYETPAASAVEVQRIYTLPGGPDLPSRDAISLSNYENLSSQFAYPFGATNYLVQRKGIATEAYFSYSRMLSATDVSIGLRTNAGTNVADAEAALAEFIDVLRKNPPDQPTVKSVIKSTLVADIIASAQQYSVAYGIGERLTKGLSLHSYFDFRNDIKEVSVDDMKRVIVSYLDDAKAINGVYKPPA